MGARQFDCLSGRFLSLDPLMDKFPDMSPYSYANNNPISFKDPTGLSPESEKGKEEVQTALTLIDALMNEYFSSWSNSLLFEFEARQKAEDEESIHEFYAMMERCLRFIYSTSSGSGSGGGGTRTGSSKNIFEFDVKINGLPVKVKFDLDKLAEKNISLLDAISSVFSSIQKITENDIDKLYTRLIQKYGGITLDFTRNAAEILSAHNRMTGEDLTGPIYGSSIGGGYIYLTYELFTDDLIHNGDNYNETRYIVDDGSNDERRSLWHVMAHEMGHEIEKTFDYRYIEEEFYAEQYLGSVYNNYYQYSRFYDINVSKVFWFWTDFNSKNFYKGK